MSDYLAPDTLDAVREAALSQFPDQATWRPVLFQTVPSGFFYTLPVNPAPSLQIVTDLLKINAVERLLDGTVPLQVWLRNAVRHAQEPGAKAVLERALSEVAGCAEGAPDLGAAADVSEIKEEIVFQDDTLEIGFLAAGAAAARSVALVTVPPYENGAPMLTPLGAPVGPHSGTCWLVADDLVVTNHHVVNARSAIGGHRPTAADADLALQAAHATVRWDVDAEGLPGTSVAVAELVACDAALDYAVLRLAEPSGRDPLPLLGAPFLVDGQDANVAVNVIQHPGGLAKRIGLRNNLVHDAGERDVRYFTDTRPGSSGSPVLTDTWQVCALHRGAQFTEVRFQGKTSAWVNVGTSVTALLADLAQRDPAVHARVTAHP